MQFKIKLEFYVLEQQLAQCGLVLAMTSQPRLAVSIIPTRVALPLRGVAEGVTIEPSVVYVSSAIGVYRSKGGVNIKGGEGVICEIGDTG